MEFLEELKSGKFNTILLIIVLVLIFHIYWTKDTKEPMAEVSGDIKEAVKQVYLADVEAIRNLSEVATKLQAGGLTVPGNLTTNGNLNIKDFSIGATKKDGIVLPRKDGRATHFDYSDNQNYIRGNTIIDGEVTANGAKLYTPANNTIQCAGRQHISGPELLYLLNKNGVVIGKEWGGNGNLQVQGNANVGSLTIGGTTIDESHLQMLTGARGVALKHISGAWTNQMNHPWVHVGQNRDIVKWEGSPANFAFIKN